MCRDILKTYTEAYITLISIYERKNEHTPSFSSKSVFLNSLRGFYGSSSAQN